MFFDLVIPLLGTYLKDTFRRRAFINTHLFYVANHCYNFPPVEGGDWWAVVFSDSRVQEQRHESMKQPGI